MILKYSLSSRSEEQDEYFRVNIPNVSLVPTPPLSPHLDLLHQHLAFLYGNLINIQHLNSSHPINIDSLQTEKFLVEKYLENYRILSQQKCVSPLVNGISYHMFVHLENFFNYLSVKILKIGQRILLMNIFESH